jgi:hypothetical protein
MAVRTTATAVGLILQHELTSDQINAFIADASLWVDNNLVGEGLSTATLTAIEKYLAAGFATARAAQLLSAKRLETTETFQRDKEASEYFKLAATLDPTGTVAGEFLPRRVRGIFRVGAGYDGRHTSAGV